jgi:hypothetical protein
LRARKPASVAAALTVVTIPRSPVASSDRTGNETKPMQQAIKRKWKLVRKKPICFIVLPLYEIALEKQSRKIGGVTRKRGKRAVTVRLGFDGNIGFVRSGNGNWILKLKSGWEGIAELSCSRPCLC